jgi:LEA14-like dessication related protein
MARTRAVRTVRKISLAVAALVCLSVLGAWLWIRGLKKPRVRVVDIRLQRFTSKHVDLLVELAVENPNSVGMELDRLEYQLWVDGRELGVGKVVPPLRVKAAGTSIVRSTLRVRYVDAVRTIFTEEAIRKLDYRLFVRSTFRTLGMDVPLEVTRTGQIVPLRVPIWRPKTLRASPGKAGTFEVVFDIRNPADVDLPILGLIGRVKYGDQVLVAVNRQEILTVPASGSRELVIPVELSLSLMVKALAGALSDERRLKFEGQVKLEPVSLIRPRTPGELPK